MNLFFTSDGGSVEGIPEAVHQRRDLNLQHGVELGELVLGELGEAVQLVAPQLLPERLEGREVADRQAVLLLDLEERLLEAVDELLLPGGCFLRAPGCAARRVLGMEMVMEWIMAGGFLMVPSSSSSLVLALRQGGCRGCPCTRAPRPPGPE